MGADMKEIMADNVRQRDGARAVVDTGAVMDEVRRTKDAGAFCHARGIFYVWAYVPICLDCVWHGGRTGVMYEALAEAAGHEDDTARPRSRAHVVFLAHGEFVGRRSRE